MKRLFLFAVVLSPVFVAACGPTTGGVTIFPIPSAYVGLLDTTSIETSTLAAFGVDSTELSISAGLGKLDRAGDSINVLALKGTVDAAQSSVALTGGGTATIFGAGQTFSAQYVAQPSFGNPTFGVVGVATHPSHLPATGNATYNGVSVLQIIDGSSLFDLSGSLTANVDFYSGIIHLTYHSLDGSKSDGISVPVAVSNVGTLTISGGTISGYEFGGGTAQLTSSQVNSTLSGIESVFSLGGFFGPGATEIGGIILIDDTSGSGTLLISGGFLGS